MWKRSTEGGNIVPLDTNDHITFVVIGVKRKNRSGKIYQGQFVFNQEILIKKGIMRQGTNKGKLAIRVFPPWSEAFANESILASQNIALKSRKTQKMSESARKTQKWQLQYFLPFNQSGKPDLTLMKAYFKKLI